VRPSADPKGIRAELAESRLGTPGVDGPRLGLMKSRSFMNETGGPVSRLLSYYKLTPDRLVVVHDELDLDPGQLRVKFGGGDNGHNGLRSIRSALGTGDYFRVGWAWAGPPAGRIRPTSC
jgi:PTH1 family peptidyl-tRNA hydrolase